MHLRCPHCHNQLELVPEAPLVDVTCPSCGSRFNILPEEKTKSHAYEKLRQIDQFELLEHLGMGQFGSVWLARDKQLDRLVAIKLPRKEELSAAEAELFVREARAAAQLNHPNIVSVHEVGRSGDTIYIVSDYILGGTLAERLAVHRFTFEESARLCATLAQALHHAHEVGVIHRDLKPSNILLDRGNQPYIADFGLARREAGEITITIEGRILGTPAYMSPEQAQGEARHADRRSDVYSLGVILYEMLAGRRPFEGGSRVLLTQVIYDDPPPPRKLNRSVPRDLETICLKALAKSPEGRYATAQEMADDLDRWLTARPILARRASLAHRVWRWRQRHPARAVAGLAVTVSLALLVTIGWLLATAGPPVVLRRVRVTTQPTGATATLIPLHPDTGLPQPELAVRPEEATPLETKAPPGEYLVVVDLQGFGFHEVFRRVPEPGEEPAFSFRHTHWTEKDGVVEWAAVEIKPLAIRDDMTFFDGTEAFNMGRAGETRTPPHVRSVPPYYLDPTEVTVGYYKQVMGRMPSGQPSGADDDAVHTLSYDDAVSFAERAGKRLPDEVEYEYAATWKGTRRLPWEGPPDPADGWPQGRVGIAEWDVLPSTPPVRGLYSNVAEWTSSWMALYPSHPKMPRPPRLLADFRIVRGGAGTVAKGAPTAEEAALGPTWREGFSRMSFQPGLGLRCAMSAQARTQPEHFTKPKSETLAPSSGAAE